ncbi:MAG TPA: LCP family protein [Frankiaceae bacterium]
MSEDYRYSGGLPPELSPRRVPAPRPRGLHRAFNVLLVLLSVMVLVGSGSMYGLYNYYNGRIAKLHLPGLANSDTNGTSANYLVVGSDSRDGATAAELRAANTTADGGGTNTDTIVLIHVPGNTAEPVTMVSFPRDSYVNVPGWPGRHKLNSVYDHFGGRGKNNSGGGPDALISTITNLSGLKIDHYMEVNFFGFMRMTDAIGGVDVCLLKPARDHFSGINLAAGVHHLSGVQALQFVRQRYGLPSGDLDRIKRQQYFAKAILTRVTSGGILVNPAEVKRVLDAATSSIYVDSGLDSITQLQDLASKMKGVAGAGVAQLTVPVANQDGHADGQSVVLLDDAKIPDFFAPLKPGYTPPAASDTPTAEASPTLAAGSLLAPGSVSVAVQNASGVNGLGRQAATDLAKVGFRVAAPTTATGAASKHTVVQYGSSAASAARTVASSIDAASVQADPSLAPSAVRVVLGSDYTTAHTPQSRTVDVTGATTAAAPTAPPTTAAPTPGPSSSAAGGIGCIL